MSNQVNQIKTPVELKHEHTVVRWSKCNDHLNLSLAFFFNLRIGIIQFYVIRII